jgi:hypothetical protein
VIDPQEILQQMADWLEMVDYRTAGVRLADKHATAPGLRCYSIPPDLRGAILEQPEWTRVVIRNVPDEDIDRMTVSMLKSWTGKVKARCWVSAGGRLFDYWLWF